jgi:nucleoside-diphosphate-sugar epimerase
MDMRKRLILLTGAAGRIGTAFREDTDARYAHRLADKDITRLSSPSHEILRLDITDLPACREACREVDTVVHLAANPMPDAEFYASLLDTNIKGTFNIFRAAKDAGCRRVVFASSAQTVEGYPLDVQITPDMPVRPKNLYGVSKCFGEALASYFAYRENLSSVAVRIGCFEEFVRGKDETARDMSAFVSRRDLVQLLVKCIEAADIRFAIVHGVSNNRFKPSFQSRGT